MKTTIYYLGLVMVMELPSVTPTYTLGGPRYVEDKRSRAGHRHLPGTLNGSDFLQC